jgi:hypothetical protein
MAALCFCGEKLDNERIYRDQASVLVQPGGLSKLIEMGKISSPAYPLEASHA